VILFEKGQDSLVLFTFPLQLSSSVDMGYRSKRHIHFGHSSGFLKLKGAGGDILCVAISCG